MVLKYGQKETRETSKLNIYGMLVASRLSLEMDMTNL